jgi:aspartate aminotransferase
MRGIIDLAVDHDLLILCDEVYSELAPRDFDSILNHPECRSIYIQSFSKTYGMTGFRVGFAVSSPEIIKGMANLQSLTVSSVSEFIQYACIEALKCWEDAENYRKLTQERIDVACKELNRLPVKYKRPEGAFYIFPRIEREGFDSVPFAWRLLREKGVCVTPGTGFGDYPAYLRISIPLREELIREGIGRMGEILSE